MSIRLKFKMIQINLKYWPRKSKRKCLNKTLARQNHNLHYTHTWNFPGPALPTPWWRRSKLCEKFPNILHPDPWRSAPCTWSSHTRTRLGAGGRWTSWPWGAGTGACNWPCGRASSSAAAAPCSPRGRCNTFFIIFVWNLIFGCQSWCKFDYKNMKNWFWMLLENWPMEKQGIAIRRGTKELYLGTFWMRASPKKAQRIGRIAQNSQGEWRGSRPEPREKRLWNKWLSVSFFSSSYKSRARPSTASCQSAGGLWLCFAIVKMKNKMNQKHKSNKMLQNGVNENLQIIVVRMKTQNPIKNFKFKNWKCGWLSKSTYHTSK